MFFFFNDTATTEIYTLSLHDALPISRVQRARPCQERDTVHPGQVEVGGNKCHCFTVVCELGKQVERGLGRDRKSTRLNSSHANISYAVFCLKKKQDVI